MKVIVCTEYGENYLEVAKITVPIFHEYCQRRGYEFRELLLEDGNKYAFKKHELFRELMMDDIDVIAYFDVDILITNLSFKIEDFLDNEHDFYITRDATELNGGAIILLNTEWGRAFNDLVLAHRFLLENEQNVFNKHEKILTRMKVCQQYKFNSYKYSLYPECKSYVGDESKGDWKEGHFVLHVPGAPYNVRVETLKNTPIIR